MSVVTVKAATTSALWSFPPVGSCLIDEVLIDGPGQLVLVKNQPRQSDNGIWEWGAGRWQRGSLVRCGLCSPCAAVLVEEGATQAGSLWWADAAVTVEPRVSFVEVPPYRPTAL